MTGLPSTADVVDDDHAGTVKCYTCGHSVHTHYAEAAGAGCVATTRPQVTAWRGPARRPAQAARGRPNANMLV